MIPIKVRFIYIDILSLKHTNVRNMNQNNTTASNFLEIKQKIIVAYKNDNIDEFINLFNESKSSDIDFKDENGNTVLMKVVSNIFQFGNNDINLLVEFLFNHRPNMDINTTNNNNETALMILCKQPRNNVSFSDVTKVFLRLMKVPGINLNAQAKDTGKTAYMLTNRPDIKTVLLTQTDFDVSLTDLDGNTILIDACLTNDCDLVENIFVLNKISELIRMKNKSGDSALSIQCNKESPNTEIIKLIVQKIGSLDQEEREFCLKALENACQTLDFHGATFFLGIIGELDEPGKSINRYNCLNTTIKSRYQESIIQNISAQSFEMDASILHRSVWDLHRDHVNREQDQWMNPRMKIMDLLLGHHPNPEVDVKWLHQIMHRFPCLEHKKDETDLMVMARNNYTNIAKLYLFNETNTKNVSV